MTPQRNKGKERYSPEPQTQPPSHKHDPDMPSSSSSFPSSSSSSSFPSSSSTAADYFSPPFVYPTDEELIFYHLKLFPQISWPNLPIHDVNIYESNPQQLSEEYEKGNLKEWFFRWERTNKGSKRQIASYVLCRIYLSPMEKKKKEDNVEALIEDVEQPRNVEYQQPQPQFWPTPLNSHQPHHQRHFFSYSLESYQSEPRDIVYHQQSHQRQFWPAPVDSSRQSQDHDIEDQENLDEILAFLGRNDGDRESDNISLKNPSKKHNLTCSVS